MGQPRNTYESIRARLANTPYGCREWTGALDTSGYGLVRFNGRRCSVHRLMWEFEQGAIPAGWVIDHLCRNRRCANTSHLRCVPARINNTENRVHDSSRRTHCPQGHAYDEANTIYSQRGWRSCRACRSLQKKAQWAATAKKGHASSQKTHCAKGHPYDDSNTRIDNRGWRKCRTCERERNRKRRANAEARRQV